MRPLSRLSCLSGYVVLAIFVVLMTTAYQDDSSRHGSPENNGGLVGGGGGGAEGAESIARPARHDKSSDGHRKRQSFSVTQDLDALAEMLREASMRRRLQNAIAFFNALKRKRDVESTYGNRAIVETPDDDDDDDDNNNSDNDNTE